MLKSAEPFSHQLRRLSADLVHTPKSLGRGCSEVIREVRKIFGHENERTSPADLLASVSHDLRNPLTSLLCMVNVLEAECVRSGRVEGPLLDDCLRAIRSSAERMKHLTGAVLAAGCGPVSQKTFRAESVEKLLQDAASLMDPLARKRGVRLSVETAGIRRDEKVRCEREEVLRVLSNLIGNAINYSSPESWVAIRTLSIANEAVFSISDKGPGIPRTDQEKIFERGWRGKNAPSKEGLGIGLSIARAIVQEQRGRIWVESEVGNGSKFFFTLPLAKGESATLYRIA
jgi:signal transduction histidine kinase